MIFQCSTSEIGSCHKCGEESHFPLRCEKVKKKKDEASARPQVQEAKLACGAAKAYAQSAKLFRSEGWKINFRTNDDYLMARDKEMKFVEEEQISSCVTTDNAALRKAYTVVFPTDEALFEKIGLAMRIKPKTFSFVEQAGAAPVQ